jgi:hypothetical protein
MAAVASGAQGQSGQNSKHKAAPSFTPSLSGQELFTPSNTQDSAKIRFGDENCEQYGDRRIRGHHVISFRGKSVVWKGNCLGGVSKTEVKRHLSC